jgi:hypothetical protein
VDQGGVVGDAARAFVQAELLGDPLGDKAGPQRLLLREPAAQIGRERDRGEQLRQPDLHRRPPVNRRA